LKNCFYPLQLITKNLSKTKNKGHPFTKVGIILMVLSNHLPLNSPEHKRVIKEIRTDMGSNAQMNRLLQGM
jgi:ATP-dependent DNA helicase RecG